MPDESPFDALVEAYRDAKTQMADTIKTVKADIVSPADPNAQRLSRSERIADLDNFLLDPVRRESEFLRLKDRYKLPEDKPIPRRLVNYVVQGLKEKAKAEKQRDARA